MSRVTRGPRYDRDLEYLGGRIRWTVEHVAGTTQTEFADRMEINRVLLSRWINDPERPPSRDNIQAIAEVGGVSAAWLQYGEGDAPQSPGSGIVHERAAPYADAPAVEMGGLEDYFDATSWRRFARAAGNLAAAGALDAIYEKGKSEGWPPNVLKAIDVARREFRDQSED